MLAWLLHFRFVLIKYHLRNKEGKLRILIEISQAKPVPCNPCHEPEMACQGSAVTAGSRSGEQAPEQKGAAPSLPSFDAVSSPGRWDLTSSSLLNPQQHDSQLTAQQPAIDGPSEEKVFQ